MLVEPHRLIYFHFLSKSVPTADIRGLREQYVLLSSLLDDAHFLLFAALNNTSHCEKSNDSAPSGPFVMSGRNAPRSKNGMYSWQLLEIPTNELTGRILTTSAYIGCQTCRQRKVKCDEIRPICNRCDRLSISCEWGFSGKQSGKSLQLRHAQSTARSRQWYLAYLRRNYGAQSTSTSSSWMTKELMGRGGARSTTTTTTITTTPWPWNDGLQSMLGVSTPAVPITDLFPPHHDLRVMELSSPEMTCSNALTMTAADQNYFRYFPSSSVVFYYMKSWEWSSLGFLYKGPAAANKIIMRMMLAIAASDMHRQGYFSSAAEKESTRRRAQYHYELAVQEFRQYLEEHGSANAELGKAERVLESGSEMIFSIMFLMITYEWYFGHSVKHFQMHIEGVRCLLKAHPEIFVTRKIADTILTTGTRPDSGMSFIPSQLLLWILYVALVPLVRDPHFLSMTNFKSRYMEISGHPRGLTGSLYNTLIESGHSALHPDYLHQCARIWGRCLWAEEYPDQQILDDMENHRALELLHHAIIIWNKIWQLALGNSKDSSMTPETLYAEIMRIREVISFNPA